MKCTRDSPVTARGDAQWRLQSFGALTNAVGDGITSGVMDNPTHMDAEGHREGSNELENLDGADPMLLNVLAAFICHIPKPADPISRCTLQRTDPDLDFGVPCTLLDKQRCIPHLVFMWNDCTWLHFGVPCSQLLGGSSVRGQQ